MGGGSGGGRTRWRLDGETEETLVSGGLNDVIRSGNTVRRSVGPWTPAVHALLRHLEQQGFTGAPRVHGMDDRDREVLDYCPGEVGNYPLSAQAL